MRAVEVFSYRVFFLRLFFGLCVVIFSLGVASVAISDVTKLGTRPAANPQACTDVGMLRSPAPRMPITTTLPHTPSYSSTGFLSKNTSFTSVQTLLLHKARWMIRCALSSVRSLRATVSGFRLLVEFAFSFLNVFV